MCSSSPAITCIFTAMFLAEPWRLAKFTYLGYTYNKFLKREKRRVGLKYCF